MDASKTSVGKPKIIGAAHWAPIGTALPTDAVTALSSAYKDLGYISSDGMSNDTSREVQELKAWGGDVVQSPQTSKKDQFTSKFVEVRNKDVLKMVKGNANVSESDGMITLRENSKELDHGVLVYDILLSGGYVKRIVTPDAQVINVGSIDYKDDDLIGYPATIQAFPYSDYDGDTHREFIQPGGTLGSLTVASVAGMASGDTKITVSEEKGSGDVYKIMIDLEAETVALGQDVSSWTTWNGSSDITAASGKIITVVEASSDGKALKAGSVTVVAKA